MRADVALTVQLYTQLLYIEALTGRAAPADVMAKLLARLQDAAVPRHPCAPTQLPDARCQ